MEINRNSPDGKSEAQPVAAAAAAKNE